MPAKKGKKQAAPSVASGALAVSAEQARQLVDKPWVEVTDADRLRILNCSDDAKHVSSARNPNHIDGILPSENGFRHKGIWKRTLDAVIEADEPEPAAQRDIHSTPAGLSNLGNTCYVNSALQVLFTNERFRYAILRLEQDVVDADDKGILREVRKLFIDMQYGPNATANPTAFVEVLQLQASEQQDAQEFQKLLMQELEKSMSKSQDPEVGCLARM